MKDLSLNRSFKYGDGLFETLRVINSKVVFLNEHFERLSQGFDILSFDKPVDFSAEWFELEILNFIKKYNTANLSSWRVRITFWRNSPGFFCPENNSISWTIETYPLTQSCFALNEKGLEIGIYKDVKISQDILSGIKSCSALPYVMAAMHKKKMGWDDALILNSIGGIAEASSSNIFILKKEQLVTPSVAEGPVQGVCRRKIIESAEELGLELTKGHITPEDLYEAEEIWLSNAVSGIRWVKNFYGSDLLFRSSYAQKMTEILNRKAKF
jgi:branched-chain amino acid aminotransferase